MTAILIAAAFVVGIVFIGEVVFSFRSAFVIAIITAVIIVPIFWISNQVYLTQIVSIYDLWGYILFGLIVAASTSLVTVLIDNANNNTGVGGLIISATVFAIAFLFFGVADIANNPQENWPWCDQSEVEKMASLITIEFANQEKQNTDPNRLVQVTPNIALSKVRSELPQSMNTYLKAAQVQLQEINGHPYQIVSLEPTNMNAFNKNGGVVPGYYRVDALNVNAKAEYISGFKMKYIPGLVGSAGLPSWLAQNDLNRYVYFNILEPNGWKAIDLQTLEVDDQLNPMYTALLTKQAIGQAAYVPDAYLILDPQTGKWDTYPITSTVNSTGKVIYDTSKVPAWVNNIFPQQMFADYLTWWGRYHNHSVCRNEGSSGQFQIDSQNDIFDTKGREYQFTMTSFNSDASVSHIIYANPRTGEVTGYLAEGELATPILESVVHRMEERSKRGTTTASSVEEIQIQEMLGKRVFFAVLTLPDIQDDYQAYIPNGFVLVQVSKSDNASSYIVGDTVNDAYRQLQRQIAQGDQDNTNKSQNSETIQVKGVIDRIGNYRETDGSLRVTFVLTNSESKTGFIRFVANADQNNALLRIGDIVTVTALSIDYETTNEAIQISSDYLATVTPPTQVPAS